MSYEINKGEVLGLFDNHIKRYVVKDLEVLDGIKPDDFGAGGCAIPQASSTFAALDLIGYLVHPQELSTVGMAFSDLLKNEKYFPEIKEYKSNVDFFDSFRDNVRSIMVHRFLLAKYDIAKVNTCQLFLDVNGQQIFNVSHFTKMTINAITKIYDDIKNDTFIINGNSKESTMEKIKLRIENLSAFEGNGFVPFNNLPTPTITIQTTRPLVNPSAIA